MDSYQVEYRLQPGCVTVSTNENQMEFFITNPTDEPIIFKNDGQVTVKEYPALGENCRANDPPGFELIFSYGSGDGDLNLAEICRNITVSRVQGGSWQIMEKYSGKGPYWQIIPRGTTVLKPKESLILLLDNLSVNDKRGETNLTVNFKAPGIQRKAELGILKLAKPQIRRFGTEKARYELEDEVRFTWTLTDYVPVEANLLLDGIPVSGNGTVLKKVTKKIHRLQVRNQAGYLTEAQTEIAFDCYSKIEITKCGSGTVTVCWDTRSMKNCRLNGQAVGKSGSREFPVTGDTEFTLTAIRRVTEITEKKTLSFFMPVILSFQANPQKKQARPLEGFLSLEQVKDPAAVPKTVVPYAAPDPGPIPPPPARITIQFSWKTKNTNSCEIPEAGIRSKNPSDACVGSVERKCTSVILRATGNYGYQVTMTKKIQ